MDNRFMAFMVLFFYSWMFRILQLTYRDAAGLWTKDWAKPIVAMVVKLVFSFILLRILNDAIGVIIPTIVVLSFVYFPWEAQVLYKNLFHRSWWGYFQKMVRHTALNIVGALACYFLCTSLAPGYSLKTFLIRLALVGLIFPTIWIVVTHKTAEFQHLLGIAKKLLGRKIKK